MYYLHTYKIMKYVLHKHDILTLLISSFIHHKTYATCSIGVSLNEVYSSHITHSIVYYYYYFFFNIKFIRRIVRVLLDWWNCKKKKWLLKNQCSFKVFISVTKVNFYRLTHAISLQLILSLSNSSYLSLTLIHLQISIIHLTAT